MGLHGVAECEATGGHRTCKSMRAMHPLTRSREDIELALKKMRSGIDSDATQKNPSFVAVTRQHPYADLCGR